MVLGDDQLQGAQTRPIHTGNTHHALLLSQFYLFFKTEKKNIFSTATCTRPDTLTYTFDILTFVHNAAILQLVSPLRLVSKKVANCLSRATGYALCLRSV